MGWEIAAMGRGSLGGKKLEMQHGGWESVAIITKRRQLNANSWPEGREFRDEGVDRVEKSIRILVVALIVGGGEGMPPCFRVEF